MVSIGVVCSNHVYMKAVEEEIGAERTCKFLKFLNFIPEILSFIPEIWDNWDELGF